MYEGYAPSVKQGQRLLDHRFSGFSTGEGLFQAKSVYASKLVLLLDMQVEMCFA